MIKVKCKTLYFYNKTNIIYAIILKYIISHAPATKNNIYNEFNIHCIANIITSINNTVIATNNKHNT